MNHSIILHLAIFRINIGRHKNFTSLSNMPKRIIGSKMENNTEYVWDVYQPTPMMSTYTIGMAVLNDHVVVQKQLGTRNISTYAPAVANSTTERGQNEYNLNHTLLLLSIYEEYFNATDELPKIDSLSVLGHQYAAMENWGLIVYKMGYHASLDMIGHELAHFWFGNLVTCKNWNE